MTIQDEIKAVEDEILKTQKNKATEFHIGKLKAKLARLRQEQEKRDAQGGGGGVGFDIKKSGNASVGLVGLPSVGKSTILNSLTGTDSEVGSYHFTTLTVVPGLLEFRGAKIQILDMPGIVSGAAKGRGRGREVLSAARSVDLIILAVDATQPQGLDPVLRELRDASIRLNEDRPNVVIRRTSKGGVTIRSTVPLTRVDEDYVKTIASEFKVVNAEIVIRQDVTPEQLVDAFAGNRAYARAFVVINKIDLVPKDQVAALVAKITDFGWDPICVSAKNGLNIDELKDRLYEELRFIRVYMRPQGGETDFEEPLVVKKSTTVGMVCDQLHRDFRKRFRYAQIWGTSAKFAGQSVGIDHELADEDVLTLILRRG